MHYSFTPSDGRSVWVGGEKTQAHSNLLYLAFRPGFYFTRVMVIPRNFRICFQNWKQTQKMPMNWYDSDTQDQNEICQIVVHNIRVKTLLTLYIAHICIFVTCVWNPIFFKKLDTDCMIWKINNYSNICHSTFSDKYKTEYVLKHSFCDLNVGFHLKIKKFHSCWQENLSALPWA